MVVTPSNEVELPPAAFNASINNKVNTVRLTNNIAQPLISSALATTSSLPALSFCMLAFHKK